eukprot:CAMPEP_0180643282 /NCGR_PEP_ID=MMETSP1037_2-20121125/47715_1 /TAXON_ID=632150 /ORGANISM="Azadinium spinosum, Strain 3D9" /LENGTH=107 /DNA_ID=CAMNT_0022666747 /DNA_START=84 /DNA_END=407 /DNA_ORIENTATION=+
MCTPRPSAASTCSPASDGKRARNASARSGKARIRLARFSAVRHGVILSTTEAISNAGTEAKRGDTSSFLMFFMAFTWPSMTRPFSQQGPNALANEAIGSWCVFSQTS